jgi:hypothetical protein
MAYFGSTIEGAAGTALQAANSIADREAASAWQRYNAMAQQQQQQAQMEQARWANQMALKQAAESDYWRRQQAQTAADQFKTSVGITREQMAQAAADRASNLAFSREKLAADKSYAEESKAENMAARKNQPNLFGYDWMDANARAEELKAKNEELRQAIQESQKMALRYGGSVDPRTGFILFPKGYNPDAVMKASPYNRQIQDATKRLESNLREYQVAEADRQRISREARQAGISFTVDPETGGWVGHSIYFNEPVKLDAYGTPPLSRTVPTGQTTPTFPYKFTELPNMTGAKNLSFTPDYFPQTPQSSVPQVSKSGPRRNYNYWFQGPLTKDRYISDFAGFTLANALEPIAAIKDAYDYGKGIDRSIVESTGTPYRAGYAGRAWNSFLGTPVSNDPSLVFPEGAVPTGRRQRFLARPAYFRQAPEPVAVPVAPPTSTVTNRTAVPIVATQSEFDSLPSGAVYIGSNGRRYRKP